MRAKNKPASFVVSIRRTAWFRPLPVWALLGLLFLPDAFGQAPASPPRIGSASQAWRYAGFDQGPLPPAQQIHDVVIELEPGPGRAALEDYAARVQDPNSPDYRQWLAPEQFAERFGAAPAVIAEVANWLQAAGAGDAQIARSRLFVRFNASAAQLNSLFQVELHGFLVGGKQHYANTLPPAVPLTFIGRIAAIRGLDDFSPDPQIQTYAGAAEINALGPGDLSILYDLNPLLNTGTSGAGVVLAVVGRTPVGLDDYRAYREMFALPGNDFNTLAVPGGGTGTGDTNDAEEATLDLEIAGAAAPGASLLYVWDSNIDTAVEWVIDNNLAQILSESYAGCEDEGDLFYQTLALQAGVEGITWIGAAGDSGAAGCDPAGSTAASQGAHTMAPAGAPSVTAVGGSALVSGSDPQYWAASAAPGAPSILSYVPESGWGSANSVLGGGGGVSQVFGKPGYQTDFLPSVTQGRMLPDVSLAASPTVAPYYMLYRGSGTLVGGTSAATALFAGVLALVESYLGPAGGGLGNINPVLYRLSETGPSAFHDIAAGSNLVPCAAGSPDCAGGWLGYAAGPGYDLATGLGSVDGAQLAHLWNTADFAPSSAVLASTSSQIEAEQSVTLTATVETQNGPLAGSPVQFYLSNPTFQCNELLLATVVTGTDGRAVLVTSALPAGVNTIQALATGTTAVAAAPLVSAAVTVALLPSSLTIQSAGATTQADQGAVLQAQVTIPAGATLSGPAGSYSLPGQITLYAQDGSVLAGPVTPDAWGSATLTTSPLAAGTYSVYAIYSGNSYVAGSQSPAVTVTVNSAVGPAPDFYLIGPASVSLQAGTSTALILSITPQNGFQQNIQLACSGLPAADSCTLPSSVTPSGVTAVPMSITAADASLAGFLPFGLLLVPGVVRRLRRRAGWMLLGMVFLGGCGSAHTAFSRPAGSVTYLVTVKAISGTITHSLVVSVTINS